MTPTDLLTLVVAFFTVLILGGAVADYRDVQRHGRDMAHRQ